MEQTVEPTITPPPISRTEIGYMLSVLVKAHTHATDQRNGLITKFGEKANTTKLDKRLEFLTRMIVQYGNMRDTLDGRD